MLKIPLQQIPNQVLHVSLDSQNCAIHLYWKDNLYMDLTVNGSVVFNGIICRNATGIKLYKYLEFSGQLIFWDTAGNSDPHPTGFDDRWRLYYLTDTEADKLLKGLIYV